MDLEVLEIMHLRSKILLSMSPFICIFSFLIHDLFIGHPLRIILIQLFKFMKLLCLCTQSFHESLLEKIGIIL